MTPRPRLLPLVIIAASALLGIKLAGLWLDGADAITAAWAQAAATADKPAAPAAKPEAGKDAAKDAKPGASPAEADRDPSQMSQEEIGVLQQLADRRAELDKRAAELNERDVLMQAAEKRINEKIAKLEELKTAIDAGVKTKDDKEDARVQSLAHMYEQMKPQEAARIIDQLDIPIILTLFDHMREQKASPILAGMDPAKAKAVTLALTDKKNSKTANAAPAAPATAAQPAKTP
jgi:flagellar motility protein MotE (MotC chaperone)